VPCRLGTAWTLGGVRRGDAKGQKKGNVLPSLEEKKTGKKHIKRGGMCLPERKIVKRGEKKSHHNSSRMDWGGEQD